MGKSKFLFGPGLSGDIAVSSTKASGTAPSVAPLARGTAKLTVTNQFAGDQSDIYDINVLDADVANESSELTPSEFQGQTERQRADLLIERRSLSAPTGDYSLECLDPGKEDTIASSAFVFEADGVKFAANESFETPSSVVGSVGNRIEIKVYTVHPDYALLNLNTSLSTYPRPLTGVSLITPGNPVNYSPIADSFNLDEFSVNRISPPELNVPVVRSDNGQIDYEPVNAIYIDPDSGEALFLPHENTPRFVLGQPLNQQQGSLSTAELLEQVYLQTVFSEYSRSQGTGIYEYAVKGTSKKSRSSDFDLPSGLVPYPVTGGYLVHVYLRAASSGDPHAADFWYTHFPLFNPNTGGYEALPITTWGEFAYALYMHQEKGVYLTSNATPITSTSHALRYPLVLVEADATSELSPRSELFTAWENREISLHTSGNMGYPSFNGAKLTRITAIRILDRNLLRQETIQARVSDVDDIGPIIDIVAPATAALPSAPPDLGQNVIARLRPGQSLSAALGVFAGQVGLDFTIPVFDAPLGSQPTITDVDGAKINWTLSLVNDSNEDPRTVKVCVHHLHASPALTEKISVNLTYRKFKASTCPSCEGYVPSPYDPSCLGDVGGGASTDQITNYFQQIGSQILTPIPTVNLSTGGITSLSLARKVWERAHLYLRRLTWTANELPDYLTSINDAIDLYTDKLFKMQIVDRSTYGRTNRRHFASPDYTILLEGEIFDGGDSLFPVTPVDPFCEDLTSGMMYGFGGLYGNAENGNAYTSWQSRVGFGLNGGGYLDLMDRYGSGIVTGASSDFFKEDRFNQSFDTDSQFIRDTLDHSKFDSTPYFDAVWGSAPNIMANNALDNDYSLDWVDPTARFIIPRLRGRGVPFDNMLHHFKYNYVDLITTTSTTTSINEVQAELDVLITDWVSWLRDPGQYLEDNYSSHADYKEIFKWLYRLPQTDATAVAGTEYSNTRWDYLWRNCPHPFSLGEANSNYQLVEVSFRYQQPGFTVTEVHFGVTSVRVIPPIDEVRQSYIVVNPDESLESVLAQVALDFTRQEVFDFSGSTAVHTPSSITLTFTYISAQVYKVQDLNRGPTSIVKSRINSLLAAELGSGGITSSQWEVIHMGSIPIGSYPGTDTVGRSTNLSANQYGRSNGQPRKYGTAGQTVDDLARKKYQNFNNFKAMEEIFYLRFLALLAKVGWKWDLENFLQTCPPPDRYTNIFGTASQSAGGCTNWSGDEDYWEVKVTSESRGTVIAHRAYTNHTYYDEQGMFAFLVASKCANELEYGDAIQITYTPAGALSDIASNYDIGETLTWLSRSGARIALQGGLSNRDTATWRFKLPDGPFPNVDLQILNRAGTPVEIPSSSINGLFQIAMQVATRYEKGDKWSWGLAGGTYRVTRRSDGAVTPVLTLSRVPVEFFSGDVVKFGFKFESKRPFIAGDKWRVTLIQDHAALNATNWDPELAWVSNGNTDETYELDLGTGNGESLTAVAIVGHNLSTSATVTLEAKDVADSWGSIPGSQQWAITIHPSVLAGFPSAPGVKLFSLPEGPWEQWRVRITDTSVTNIRIARVFFGNAGNGVFAPNWDHDIYTAVKNVINPNDSTSDVFKSMAQEMNLNYSMMESADFRLLWSVFYASKSANNEPFVFVSNSDYPEKIRFARFTRLDFPFVERTGEQSSTRPELASDIRCEIITVDGNRSV